MKAHRVVVAETRKPRKRGRSLPAEELLVLRARAGVEPLGACLRELQALHARAQALLARSAGRAQPLQGIAAGLPHIERALRRVLLSVDDAWNDLEASFSARDLAQAIEEVQEPDRPPRTAPKTVRSARPRAKGRRADPRAKRVGAGQRRRRAGR